MNLAIVRRVLVSCENVVKRQLKPEFAILINQPHQHLSSFPRIDPGNNLNAVQLNKDIVKRSYAKFSRGKSSSKDGNEEENENEEVLQVLQGVYGILSNIILLDFYMQEIDPMLLQDVDGNDVKIIKTKLNSLRLDTLLKAGLGISKRSG